MDFNRTMSDTKYYLTKDETLLYFGKEVERVPAHSLIRAADKTVIHKADASISTHESAFEDADNDLLPLSVNEYVDLSNSWHEYANLRSLQSDYDKRFESVINSHAGQSEKESASNYFLTRHDIRLDYFSDGQLKEVVLPRHTVASINADKMSVDFVGAETLRLWEGDVRFINLCDISANSFEINAEEYDMFRKLEMQEQTERQQRNEQIAKICEKGDDTDDMLTADKKMAEDVINLVRKSTAKSAHIIREEKINELLESKGAKSENKRIMLKSLSECQLQKRDTMSDLSL